MSFFLLLSLQWAVCDRQTLYRQEYRHRICSQVHQEAAESGQQAWREERGDRAGGGHPAADHAPQHRRAARRVREPHRCGAHPRTVSHGTTPQHLHSGRIIVSVLHCGGVSLWTQILSTPLPLVTITFSVTNSPDLWGSVWYLQMPRCVDFECVLLFNHFKQFEGNSLKMHRHKADFSDWNVTKYIQFKYNLHTHRRLLHFPWGHFANRTAHGILSWSKAMMSAHQRSLVSCSDLQTCVCVHRLFAEPVFAEKPYAMQSHVCRREPSCVNKACVEKRGPQRTPSGSTECLGKLRGTIRTKGELSTIRSDWQNSSC